MSREIFISLSFPKIVSSFTLHMNNFNFLILLWMNNVSNKSNKPINCFYS